MLIEVDTTEYEEEHMKKPRGRGRWVFNVFHSFRSQAEEIHYNNIPYSIAKMRVLQYANSLKALKVSLDSFQSSHWPTS